MCLRIWRRWPVLSRVELQRTATRAAQYARIAGVDEKAPIRTGDHAPPRLTLVPSEIVQRAYVPAAGFPRDTKNRTVSRASLIGSANESAFAVRQQRVSGNSAIRATGKVVHDLKFRAAAGCANTEIAAKPADANKPQREGSKTTMWSPFCFWQNESKAKPAKFTTRQSGWPHSEAGMVVSWSTRSRADVSPRRFSHSIRDRKNLLLALFLFGFSALGAAS